MSQTQTSKAADADERTEAARSFVRTVKAAGPVHPNNKTQASITMATGTAQINVLMV